MHTRLIALKLYLDELNVSHDTSTVSNRKVIQKAVYLGQYAGADLGYRFVWHKMGPFSANLARDYYKLSEALALGDKDYEEKELRETQQQSLHEIVPILEPPNIKIKQPEWLELVSSLHYLRKITRLPDEEAEKVLASEKPGLISFTGEARSKLTEIERLEFN